MRVFAHIDPVSLEHALVDRIESAADGGRPVLVLVPTQRLGDHLQRRLLERRAAWIGVEVVDLGRLPAAILDRETTKPHPTLLSEQQRSALVAGLLRGRPDGWWARHARRRSGTVRRLRAALDDLREAGIAPEAALAAAARGEEATRELARLYADHVASLERLTAESDRTDLAGLARLAVPLALGFGRRFDAVLLHGAYEVVGAQLDLLRALDADERLTVLLPADAAGRVGAYARAFATRHLTGGDDAAILGLDDAPGRRAAAVALSALYDETARPELRPPARFAFRSAQGSASEVAFAVREALAAVAAGCPAEEIVIAARDLASYLPALEEALDERGLPWTSPIRAPLRREPLVRDLLALLRVVDEDFPRGPTAELLRSERVRWESLTGAGAPDRRIDGWSREARLIGGLDEWRVELAAWAADARVDEDADEDEREAARRRAESRAAAARAAGAALDRLRERLDPTRRRRRWTDHRRLLVETIDGLLRLVDDRDRAAAAALVALCDELPLLDRLPGAATEVAFGEMRRRLEEAVDAASWRPHRRDGGGLRVLDAMQLRGLTCRRLWLVGLNAGAFPRRGSLDPVLDDDARRTLRETTGRPLPIAAERLDEERLLLALTLGAATESVTVVWQRADESGRARSASPAAREIARIVTGRPDPTTLDPLELPSHPGEWLETAASVTGLLAPDERATVIALRGGADRIERLAADAPELTRGLALIRATERFEPGPTPYDGAVGRLAAQDTLSVSAMDTLGGCPLRFFFSRVLGVGELREPASPWLLEPREMGTIGHRALELVYGRLRDDGLFDDGDGDAAAARAAELIAPAFDEAAGSLVARLRRRLPVLWDGQRAAWLAALTAFTRADLTRLIGEGWRPAGLERPVERMVDFDGRRIVLRGRFDREMTAAGGVVDATGARPERLIGDYKTTKELGRLVSPSAIVRGHALQMPLYRELAGPGSSVEVLRIGPAPAGAEADPAPRRTFDGFADPTLEAGFRETVAVLLDLVQRGRYPLRPDDYVCGELCPYERACRRGHPPTLQREIRSPDVARFSGLANKSDKKPLLDPSGEERS